MEKYIKELEKIFEDANKSFIRKNAILFQTQVSERTLCGALMIEIHEELKRTKFSDYFVDVEYNRNIGGKLKTLKKQSRDWNIEAEMEIEILDTTNDQDKVAKRVYNIISEITSEVMKKMNEKCFTELT